MLSPILPFLTNSKRKIATKSFFSQSIPSIGKPSKLCNYSPIKTSIVKATSMGSFFHQSSRILSKQKACDTSSLCSSSLSSDTDSADHIHTRLMISFTCKVCSFRSTKHMSKQAYDHGVVIIQCSSCKNYHLIADHLGWFRDSRITIEDLMAEQGEKVRRRLNDGEALEWTSELIAEEAKKLREEKKLHKRKLDKESKE